MPILKIKSGYTQLISLLILYISKVTVAKICYRLSAWTKALHSFQKSYDFVVEKACNRQSSTGSYYYPYYQWCWLPGSTTSKPTKA